MATKKQTTEAPKESAAPKTQAEIIKAIAEKTGLSQSQVKDVLSAQSAMATEELKTTGNFLLIGFGKLKAKETAARTGRNPSNGEEVQIAAGTRVTLTVGKGFKTGMQK